MREARFADGTAVIRWTEVPGKEPARVYVHGLGAASAPYYAAVVAHPALAGRRSLLVDLPGFGLSDRPADFGYTLDDHAAALAAALDAAGVRGAELVAHSMGGAVAIVLAARRPGLVSRLVLIEANLDPDPPVTAGSSGIARYREEDFVHGGGLAEVLRRVGPRWAATMRLADPVALHRSAVGLVRGTRPAMRDLLCALDVPRVFVQGGRSGELDGRAGLEAAGVEVRTVPGAGHLVMFDDPEALVDVISGP